MKAAEIDGRDRAEFDKVAARSGSVYMSNRWIDAVAPSCRRYGVFDRGGRLVGGFLLDVQRRMGFPTIRNPPYTPSVGPFFEAKAQNPAVLLDQKRQVTELFCQTVVGLRPAVVAISLERGWVDALPFIWAGFKSTTAFTYTLDLRLTEEELWDRLSSDRRKSIRKARRDGLMIVATEDVETVIAFALDTLRRRRVGSYPESLNRLATEMVSCGQAQAWIAQESGRAIAGALCVHDRNTAYYVCGGLDPMCSHHGAVASCLWEAILWARGLDLKVFDFEGSSVPGVERFFRGFGGQFTTVVRLTKAWLPLEMALKLRYRAQF